jgi:hypothetical protein
MDHRLREVERAYIKDHILWPAMLREQQRLSDHITALARIDIAAI